MSRLNTKKLTRFKSQPNSPHEVRYNCVHCGDMGGRLWVNFKKGVWTCFHCGESGTVLPRDISQVVGEDVKFRGETVRQFNWTTYPNIRGTGTIYLDDRHVPLEDALAWGVRSGKGDASGRLVIPVKYQTRQGIRTVFRVAHATTDTTFPKELQSGDRKPWILGWTEDKLPYWYEQGQKFENVTAVIVEGAADALRLASAAKSDAKTCRFIAVVCLWGKHLAEDTAFSLSLPCSPTSTSLSTERMGSPSTVSRLPACGSRLSWVQSQRGRPSDTSGARTTATMGRPMTRLSCLT